MNHTLYYFDLNDRKPTPNLYWLWPIGTIVLYAAIGVMLAWRG